jgi:hypothetical protein
MPGSQSTDLLDKSPRRAVPVVTEEPPNPQPQQRRQATDRGVIDTAFVTTMHPLGFAATPRTRRLACLAAGSDDHPTSAAVDPLDNHTGQVRQQPNQGTF